VASGDLPGLVAASEAALAALQRYAGRVAELAGRVRGAGRMGGRGLEGREGRGEGGWGFKGRKEKPALLFSSARS
jgi:hypothetical protein